MYENCENVGFYYLYRDLYAAPAEFSSSVIIIDVIVTGAIVKDEEREREREREREQWNLLRAVDCTANIKN